MIDFEKGKKFRFNVWAFFLGLFWQLYHKLYLVLVFVIVFMILELNIKNLVLSSLDLDKDVNYLFRLCETIVFGILYGFTGNYFLMQKARSTIKKVLSTETDENRIHYKLIKAGSGNTVGLIVLIVFIAGCFVLASVNSKVWGNM